MKKGIDVSSFQGDVDWEKVKNEIDFAIIRCGFGGNLESQDDNKYERNTEECERLNIPYGVYLYSYATTIEEAQSEVDHTLRLIKNKKIEYPIYLDVESKIQSTLPNETLNDIVYYYCKKVEEAGYYVGIYANLDWFVNKLNESKLDVFDHWLAQWSEKPTYNKPFGMWQYSSKLKLDGILDFVDGDIAYKDYPELIRSKGLNHLEKTLKYKVGDTVTFSGTLYQDSYGNGPGQKRKNLTATITRVNSKKDATKPYNINNGLGWVSESDLKEATKQDLKVGDKVEIIKPGRASIDGSGKIAWGIGYKRIILKYYENSLYPYQVGNEAGTTGFYKRDALKKL